MNIFYMLFHIFVTFVLNGTCVIERKKFHSHPKPSTKVLI